MDETAPTDVRELIDRFRRGTTRPAIDAFREAGGPLPEPVSAHVQHEPELAYVNQHWVLPTNPPDPAPGRFLALRRRMKAAVSRTVLSVLGRYLLGEREFLAALTRFQNDVARRADTLSEELHALVVAARLEESRLRERDEILHRALEERIASLERRRKDEP